MQNFYDHKKFAILFVDDEELTRKGFLRQFNDQFTILLAPDAPTAWNILQERVNEIGLIVTDQRMPGETGVQLLEKARRLNPRIIRILASAYSDYNAAIQAVNAGAIYKFIIKPWEVTELEANLRRGLEFFQVQGERDRLLREKVTVLHKLVVTDRVISLGVLASSMGHHVRNALVAVRMFLEMVPARLRDEAIDLDQMRNPHYWKEFYEHVVSQIERICEMLTQLGMISTDPTPPVGQEVRLRDVIERVRHKLRPQLEEKNLRIDNQLADDLPSLMVDFPKFSQIFELLLLDEIVNLPKGGVITFRGTAVDGPAGAGEIRVEMKDNGPGLPEESLRSIFDPFFLRTDQPKEFGINLMACYFMVYHHGGRIEVKNSEGDGVAFILTLPTKPTFAAGSGNGQDFLSKVLLNDNLWEKLLAGL